MQIVWIKRTVVILLALAGFVACSGGTATSLVADVSDDSRAETVTAAVDVLADVGHELAFDFGSSDDSGPDLHFSDTLLEVHVGPEMGEAGWPCEGHGDCISGFCIPTPEGKQCTIQCDQECPFGWECALHQASLPDEVFICVVPDVILCRPCTLNTECLAAGADTGAMCVSYGNDGSFCATPCSQTVLCDEPYKCLSGTDATGADVEACVLELPECQCTPLFADEGAWTTCTGENEFGACDGQRMCTAAGLSGCDAAVPEAETCNGSDDDCDGHVDEDTSGAECFVENEHGSCPGAELCLGGTPVCDAPAPEPESCDGVDNNCNDEVDEGYPDTDGDGTADCMETDKDNDGVVDGEDNCPFVFNPEQEDFDLDGDGDQCDPDDDGDKVADEEDCAPYDDSVYPEAEESCDGADNNCNQQIDEGFPDTDEDGIADCVDTDKDGDGIPNSLDNCPDLFNPPQADLDGDGKGNDCDEDLDGDGVANLVDNCLDAANPGQENEDADALGDICDDDDDGDGVADEQDNCPMTENPLQEDTDGDGAGDACEEDLDGDKVPDLQDNCPDIANPDQEDCDANGTGDACQEGDDSDGVVDGKDNCLCLVNPLQGDVDEDGLGDACDTDVDGDGIANGLDNCPDMFNPAQENLDGDQWGDLCDGDMDGDDWDNAPDNCPMTSNPEQEDLDGDGIGNVCDDDDDGDGDPDATDCQPLDKAVHNGAEEQCDGVDNNCALGVDEGFVDTDLDAFKDCVDLDDDNDLDPDDTDCAPLDPAVHAGANESCNGEDDNCNGETDEGFGDLECGLGQCQHSVPQCLGGVPQFCNPYEGSTQESCDGLDNDCDGEADEGLGMQSCGLGECTHSVPACEEGQPLLCDPLEGTGDEVCDGLDNDCDGPVDEGLGTQICGQGACQQILPACEGGEMPPCDPFAGAAEEVCNNADDNCDGFIDEGLGQITCGLGNCEHTVDNCVDGKPQLCDPLAGAQVESCDGIDNDCDGLIDDGLGATSCGQGICLHTVENCLNGQLQLCDPMEGAGDEVCFNGIDENCSGDADEGCTADTCLDLYSANPGLPSGAYTIDPDGDGGNPAFEVWCDMEMDGGGWTLVSWYTSNQELHIFDPTKHQIQDSNNGSTVPSPPSLWQDDVWGHVAYDWFEVSGRELKMQCRNSPSANWFSYTRDNLFSNWTNGDKGSYGNGSGWGVFRWQNGRSSHWVCGQSVGPTYPGIAYCKGPGVSGQFSNHLVSISFDPDHNYGGGTAMGCNGSGIDHGKAGQWQARVWVR